MRRKAKRQTDQTDTAAFQKGVLVKKETTRSSHMKRKDNMSTITVSPPPPPSSSSSSTTTKRAAPAPAILVRKPSGPFLRKPVPAAIPDGHSNHQSLSSSNKDDTRHQQTQHDQKRRPAARNHTSSSSSSQSYSSLPATAPRDDDDPPANVPIHVISSSNSNNTNTLERHLTLTDLVAIGVGGTIGSGLFVLAGLVAHEYAGPAATLSWLVSGVAAILSGCCYAELAARIPIAGSAYAYSYVSMGELPAVLAAACLSLEYMAASAAVARSWGDKASFYCFSFFVSIQYLVLGLCPG
jgi:Amino acid permease